MLWVVFQWAFDNMRGREIWRSPSQYAFKKQARSTQGIKAEYEQSHQFSKIKVIDDEEYTRGALGNQHITLIKMQVAWID